MDPSDESGPSLGRSDKLPIKLLQDRLLVQVESVDGERRSSGGIVIPATAQLSRRLCWADVRAVGPLVRNVRAGDRVLFNDEELFEVEVQGDTFVLLRERDVHAVASTRLEDESNTGLYL